MHAQALACVAAPVARRPRWEVADILRAFWPKYLRDNRVSLHVQRAITAMMACRTAELGGHLELCGHCGYHNLAYNSCGNRHCPKCQCLEQARWLQERKERILPVGHFHVVFTLPEPLRPVCRRNPRLLYGLLFEAATKTLLTLGRDPKHLGAQVGITAVLHTWSRTLSYHPHLHCIVTGGGLSRDQQRWVDKPGRYLFPVKLMGRLFRAKWISRLRALYRQGALDLAGACTPLQSPAGFDVFVAQLLSTNWVVYAKRPLGGAEQVYSYLGRYTHRVGLSNYRIRSVDGRGVCFRTKKGKSCTLSPLEFIRRFVQHVLPRGLVKIRHYGLLAGSNVGTKWARAHTLLQQALAGTASVPKLCPRPPTATAPRQPQPEMPPPGSSDAQVKAGGGSALKPCPRCQRSPLLRIRLVPLAMHLEQGDGVSALDTC